MLKVLKFGGTSMADAAQYRKIRDIVRSDPSRRVVVVSAAGKRFADDNKITDLLFLCYAHLQYGVSYDSILDMIRERYIAIRDELGLKTDLESEFDNLRKRMDSGISREELVSRGEYFSALLWRSTSASGSSTRRSGFISTTTAQSIRKNPTPRCKSSSARRARSFRASTV